MITAEQFERGLRLDQYIATISQNKENFRANFIKAIELFTSEDLAFFRSLPQKVHVAVLTDDGDLNALRDVPIISRLSVEIGKMALKIFRPATHADSAQELNKYAEQVVHDQSPKSHGFPVIVFMRPDMSVLGVNAGPHPDIVTEMHRRHQAWASAHPEIKDAHVALVEMSPITRTRATQAIYTLTPEQRAEWSRKTIDAWKVILRRMSPA
jgi:hypothetical protein